LLADPTRLRLLLLLELEELSVAELQQFWEWANRASPVISPN